MARYHIPCTCANIGDYHSDMCNTSSDSPRKVPLCDDKSPAGHTCARLAGHDGFHAYKGTLW